MPGCTFLHWISVFARTKCLLLGGGVRLWDPAEDLLEAEGAEEGGESEGGEDVEEQTGAGTDVRSRLDVRFGLQPVEKDLNRLPQGTDAGGHSIFGNKNIVLFPLSRRDERDVPLGLQMGSPFCVDIGTICIEQIGRAHV